MPDFSLYQVGWLTRKLADKFSVILLRHVTNNKVIIRYFSYLFCRKLNFLIFRI